MGFAGIERAMRGRNQRKRPWLVEICSAITRFEWSRWDNYRTEREANDARDNLARKYPCEFRVRHKDA